MSTRASVLGCNGTVVLGKIRDLNEHVDLKYPVFAYGLGTTAPTTVVKVVGVDVPIEVQVLPIDQDQKEPDVRVIWPGDYVVADLNGVVVIPAKDPEFVNKVMAAIPPRINADQLVAQDIKQNIPAAKAQKARRAGL